MPVERWQENEGESQRLNPLATGAVIAEFVMTSLAGLVQNDVTTEDAPFPRK